MFGLQLDATQLTALLGSVLGAALTAFTTLTFKFMRVLKEERVRAETQGDKFISAISTQNKEFRDLTYRIVEQRDRDIERTVEALQKTATALQDNTAVCARMDRYLIATNGALEPGRGRG
jgi:hypothetical protein